MNHPTDTTLSFLNEKFLKRFNDELLTGMILIGFQEVFDTINFYILLWKLSVIDFPDDSVKWFKSYLSNQKFFANLDNSFSENLGSMCDRSIYYNLSIVISITDIQK